MNIRSLILMGICAASLCACACPRTSDEHHGVPYEKERTAGAGQNDVGCFRRTFL